MNARANRVLYSSIRACYNVFKNAHCHTNCPPVSNGARSRFGGTRWMRIRAKPHQPPPHRPDHFLGDKCSVRICAMDAIAQLTQLHPHLSRHPGANRGFSVGAFFATTLASLLRWQNSKSDTWFMCGGEGGHYVHQYYYYIIRIVSAIHTSRSIDALMYDDGCRIVEALSNSRSPLPLIILANSHRMPFEYEMMRKHAR